MKYICFMKTIKFFKYYKKKIFQFYALVSFAPFIIVCLLVFNSLYLNFRRCESHRNIIYDIVQVHKIVEAL